jgi:serine/threonine protein kinase
MRFLVQFSGMQSSLPQPGAIVAEKYVIARQIGRGGMGAVYVVEHRITGKKLALKCLLPEHVEHPEFVERFLREAQAAGRIEHRNVVDVFDVGQDGQLIYIVMELLDGKPLSELLRAGQLSLEETLQILVRAMNGVAAAHAVGIVHRDLKPDNIFVCVGQSGRLDDPRVLDFGISKLEDDVSKPLTKSGVMLGTPYYMAFEQINSQRDLDQRVDVYAMGVILYEAMAGQLPYIAESVGALAIRMMSGPPVPLSQLRPELPEGLAEVVMRSVARDRDQRFPGMQGLIEAIKPYASTGASLFPSKGPGTPLGSTLRSSRAIDATLPAMPSLPASGGESSARLKLDGIDSLAGRTPSAPNSAKLMMWVLAGGLLIILAGVTLAMALRGPAVSEPLVEPTREAEPAQPAPSTMDKRAQKPSTRSANEEPAKQPEPAARAAEEPEPSEPTPSAASADEPANEPANEAPAPAKGGKATKARARARARSRRGEEPEAPYEPAGGSPAAPAAAEPAPAAAAPAEAKPVELPPAPAPVMEAKPEPAAAPAAETKPEAAPAPAEPTGTQ